MIIKPSDRLTGVGEYYFSSKLKEVARLISEGKEVINLGIGSPDMLPPVAAIQSLVTESQKSGVHGYQPYQGIAELRAAISGFYKNHYRVDLQPDEILPLMGSKEGIMHISLAYLNAGDGVCIPELGYPTYTSVSKLALADILYFPMREESDWEPDWNFLHSATNEHTKLIWVNYPHMPTGCRGSLGILEKFVKLAREKQVLLCHDNPYSFIRNDNPMSIFQVEGAKEVALELNSLSKTFNMAGWRIGWVCGSRELLDPVLKVKSNMDSGMFRPIQVAAVNALKEEMGWFEGMNREYMQRQNLVFTFLDKLDCTYSTNQSGLFVWAKTKGESGSELCDRLLYENQVFVTPGEVFGKKGLEFIRVSLCQPTEVLEKAIKRIA